MDDEVKPKDAITVERILESMGIEKYEPRVVEQILELIYRYVSDVLSDALVYKDHSDRNELDLNDVRLAIQSRVNYSFTEPPPEEFLLEVANEKNSTPLFIPSNPCVILPPPEHCLASVNYQLNAEKIQKIRNEKQQQQQKSQQK